MTTLASPSSFVLVTGGTSGIGRGLAERFLSAGATVLVTGRKADQLKRLAAELPGIRTFSGDIGRSAEREDLARHIKDTLPFINILVNNAGFQRRVSLADDDAPWSERQAEIDVLLSGPVHLNHLLVPQMLAHGQRSLIINVTSGGAYLPMPFAPIYSASKAALHSYTVNLRFALADTNIKVKELIPPAVATQLAGPDATHGVPLDTFCDQVFPLLMNSDQEEIGFGMTATKPFSDAKEAYQAMFEQSSRRFPVKTFAR